MEPLELFVVRSDRARYWLLLAVALAFTAIGVLLLAVEKNTAGRLTAAALILFFGAAVVVFVRELSDRRPRIRIDESGVNDRTLGVGAIPWSEITAAYRMDVQGSPFICLVLRDSPAKRAMIQANRALGCTEFNLNLSGIDVEAEQLFELVLKLSAESRKHNA